MDDVIGKVRNRILYQLNTMLNNNLGTYNAGFIPAILILKFFLMWGNIF